MIRREKNWQADIKQKQSCMKHWCFCWYGILYRLLFSRWYGQRYSFLIVWYSLIQSPLLYKPLQGGIIPAAKNMAQISNGISNPVVAGIVYWLIRILICGGCLVGAGIFLAFIGIKIVGLYKKYCWDMITIMVILISMATAIYFGNWIKTALPINLLFFLLFVQLVYVGIRWYVKGCRENRGCV